MSNPIISVENLGKAYRLGLKDETPDSLVGMATSWIKAPLKNFKKLRRLDVRKADTDDEDVFWALKDVSFEVNQGDVVGIIGRNGAGKSTLLKLLSRITEPTAGRAVIRGRVSSLLEVGTGFHPELSGRDNIYMNGTILGMKKREIDNKFDEIVDFSGVEKFLDTPVKRYSSGMLVRLAFSVAAHLEPEILIVDEVLAVGDAMFQSKCLGKMQDVAKSGRTVLFVSHNMGAVETLCTKGLVISSGQIVANTTSKEAIQIYLREMETASDSDLAHRTDRSGVGRSQLQSIEITAGKDFKEKTLVTGDPARFTYYINYTFPGMIAVVSIYDTNGQAVVDFRSRHSGDGDYLSAQLHNKFICETDELLLAPGRYRMDIEIYCSQELQDHVTGAIYFDVAPGNIRGRMTSAPIRHAKAMMPNRWILPLKGSI